MSDSRFTATKFDQSKPPMDLIPWEAMEGVARVLDFGRVKYAPHNWRKGFEWGRLAGAALRHIFKFLSGEDRDPESGEYHIDHAICCLMFLSAHIQSDLGRDNRAHNLLGEPRILAAQVPKHKNKGYRLWLRDPGCWSASETVFISRELAERQVADHVAASLGLVTEDYEIREVEFDS